MRNITSHNKVLKIAAGAENEQYPNYIFQGARTVKATTFLPDLYHSSVVLAGAPRNTFSNIPKLFLKKISSIITHLGKDTPKVLSTSISMKPGIIAE